MSDHPEDRPEGENAKRRTASSIFLPKETYRQRRLLDAVRIWPVLGAFLFGLPVLWTLATVSNVNAMIYLFGVWALLIAGAAHLSSIAKRTRAEMQDRLPEPPSETQL